MRASRVRVIVAGEHAMKVRDGNMAPRKSCATNGLTPVWRHRDRVWRHKKRCADNTIAHYGAIALSCPTTTIPPSRSHLRSLTLSYDLSGIGARQRNEQSANGLGNLYLQKGDKNAALKQCNIVKSLDKKMAEELNKRIQSS